ncbi:MAG: hypothetical protein M3373_14055 [Gemmatimonadota bacterium]|nr:hypothetical protein [Gemmatimonadota bacterium]
MRPLAIAGLALLATILILALIRNKPTGRTAANGPPPPTHADTLDLAAKPHLLFQVFGTRDSLRMAPIAAIANGRLTPIVLDAEGWRGLDAMYLRKDAVYTLYQDGSATGTARVLRGMWEDERNPVYRLEGCRSLVPLAAVELDTRHPQSFAVELLASTAPLGWRHPAQPLEMPQLLAAVRDIAAAAGRPAAMGRRTLDSLDSRAVAIPTGATAGPTLVVSWLDSAASNARRPAARTRHLFLIADQDSTGAYTATHVHRVAGALETAEFRRYIDHLDLTGDGVDEIIVEGWRFGGDNWLAILAYEDGSWREVFRSPTDWCLDVREDQN